jgi:methyltransferase-like protein
MTKKRYEAVVNGVIELINEGVVLMTEKEEYTYKKQVIKDLQIWLKAFPFMHLIPEQRRKRGI